MWRFKDFLDESYNLNSQIIANFYGLITLFYFILALIFLLVGILCINIYTRFFKNKLNVFDFIAFYHFLIIGGIFFYTIFLCTVFTSAPFFTVYWCLPLIVVYISALRYYNPGDYLILSFSWEKIPLFILLLSIVCSIVFSGLTLITVQQHFVLAGIDREVKASMYFDHLVAHLTNNEYETLQKKIFSFPHPENPLILLCP